VQRRLAAVAFADVAGFSRLVEANDVETTRRWKALRHDLLEPKIHEHHGKLLRVIGDALFVEFGSAVDAVQWAHDVQRALADPGVEPVGEPANEPIQLRIGINVEDVMVDGDDLHGDGVNIAARVQQLAKPGETLVTAAVYEYVWNKVGIAMTDGEQAFKNIRRPIRVYKLGRRMPESRRLPARNRIYPGPTGHPSRFSRFEPWEALPARNTSARGSRRRSSAPWPVADPCSSSRGIRRFNIATAPPT
jgi:class 3 adenylate cyclase